MLSLISCCVAGGRMLVYCLQLQGPQACKLQATTTTTATHNNTVEHVLCVRCSALESAEVPTKAARARDRAPSTNNRQQGHQGRMAARMPNGRQGRLLGTRALGRTSGLPLVCLLPGLWKLLLLHVDLGERDCDCDRCRSKG